MSMEYNSVTLVAYFSAAVISALLTATYLFQLVRHQKTWLFAGAAAVHTLHLSAIALSFSANPIPLYLLIILASVVEPNFWWLLGLLLLFNWMSLVGVVRAEFLRARNFEYVRAARALGVNDRTIMFRHILPNAMVATLTMLPFVVTGTISSLAALDYLGYGLPSSAPSLGELALQAKQNLQAPWLAFTAFFTFAIMLSLLVFVFEGVRDAFDPRKTFK